MIKESKIGKKKPKMYKRKVSHELIFCEDEGKCGSEIEPMDYGDDCEEDKFEEKEEEGKGDGKLIRASSIVNMKITEKIMVLSGESDCSDDEDWEKAKKWK